MAFYTKIHVIMLWILGWKKNSVSFLISITWHGLAKSRKCSENRHQNDMKAIHDFKIPKFHSIINNTLDCGGCNVFYARMESLKRKQMTKKVSTFTHPYKSKHKTAPKLIEFELSSEGTHIFGEYKCYRSGNMECCLSHHLHFSMANRKIRYVQKILEHSWFLGTGDK